MQKFSALAAVLAALTVTGCGTVNQVQTPTASKPDTVGTILVSGIELPGQSVRLPDTCQAATSQTAKVVCAAEAFLAALTPEQRASVVLEATPQNAATWSNVPAIVAPRLGIALGSLSSSQREAALGLMKAATGSGADDGYSEITQLLMADNVLNASGWTPPPPGSDSNGAAPPDAPVPDGPIFSSGNYYLALLGTPSTTGTWMLKFGGHHIAVNTTYKAGQVASPTPLFTGDEPLVWQTETATYAPFTSELEGMVALLASLSAEQLGAAKLSQTFSDIVLGPGQDGKFPATKVGLKISSLSAEQKALVLAAMKPFIRDADDATAAALLATYEQELADSYLSFSGDPSLSHNADYVRIDGPSVWMEFLGQTGIVYDKQVHYHAMWRDHIRDYGGEYSF